MVYVEASGLIIVFLSLLALVFIKIGIIKQVEVFQPWARFCSPWCPLWNLGGVLCYGTGKNVTGIQNIWHKDVLESTQTLKLDQTGFVSELFNVSFEALDKLIQCLCAQLPLRDSGDNTRLLELFYHSAQYMKGINANNFPLFLVLNLFLFMDRKFH